MQDSESPQDVHRILLAHFSPADVQALDLIYDNSCTLSEFFLNRNIEDAKSMRFYVDTLHYEVRNPSPTHRATPAIPPTTPVAWRALPEQTWSAARP